MGIGVVGNFLQGWGIVEQSGTGTSEAPPSSPTLAVSDNGDGTATATISSSDTGATNIVYVQSAFSSIWSDEGGRVGNGSVTLTLQGGRYFAYVLSELNGQQSVSNVVLFRLEVGSNGESLDHSPADILRYLLIDLGLGTLPESEGAWPVYATNEPSLPDNCVTVYNTSGRMDGRSHPEGDYQEHYGVQIRVRASKPRDGWAKAKAISTAIDRSILRETVVIDTDEYLVDCVDKQGGILDIGKDVPQGKRNLFTLNCTIDIRQVS